MIIKQTPDGLVHRALTQKTYWVSACLLALDEAQLPLGTEITCSNCQRWSTDAAEDNGVVHLAERHIFGWKYVCTPAVFESVPDKKPKSEEPMVTCLACIAEGT